MALDDYPAYMSFSFVTKYDTNFQFSRLRISRVGRGARILTGIGPDIDCLVADSVPRIERNANGRRRQRFKSRATANCRETTREICSSRPLGILISSRPP